jgi:hypothetical protein
MVGFMLPHFRQFCNSSPAPARWQGPWAIWPTLDPIRLTDNRRSLPHASTPVHASAVCDRHAPPWRIPPSVSLLVTSPLYPMACSARAYPGRHPLVPTGDTPLYLRETPPCTYGRRPLVPTGDAPLYLRETPPCTYGRHPLVPTGDKRQPNAFALKGLPSVDFSEDRTKTTNTTLCVYGMIAPGSRG